MPRMTLDVGDAVEFAELLQFVRNWFTSDHDHLDTSLNAFIGNPGRAPGYDLDRFRTDLDRFTYLHGGNNGEPLFHPEPR